MNYLFGGKLRDVNKYFLTDEARDELQKANVDDEYQLRLKNFLLENQVPFHKPQTPIAQGLKYETRLLPYTTFVRYMADKYFKGNYRLAQTDPLVKRAYQEIKSDPDKFDQLFEYALRKNLVNITSLGKGNKLKTYVVPPTPFSFDVPELAEQMKQKANVINYFYPEMGYQQGNRKFNFFGQPLRSIPMSEAKEYVDNPNEFYKLDLGLSQKRLTSPKARK